jgi:hypothetical protein
LPSSWGRPNRPRALQFTCLLASVGDLRKYFPCTVTVTGEKRPVERHHAIMSHGLRQRRAFKILIAAADLSSLASRGRCSARTTASSASKRPPDQKDPPTGPLDAIDGPRSPFTKKPRREKQSPNPGGAFSYFNARRTRDSGREGIMTLPGCGWRGPGNYRSALGLPRRGKTKPG